MQAQTNVIDAQLEQSPRAEVTQEPSNSVQVSTTNPEKYQSIGVIIMLAISGGESGNIPLIQVLKIGLP